MYLATQMIPQFYLIFPLCAAPRVSISQPGHVLQVAATVALLKGRPLEQVKLQTANTLHSVLFHIRTAVKLPP